MSYKRYELGKICHISAGGDRPEVCSDIKTEKTPVPIFSNGMENDGLYGYTDKAKVEGDVVTVSARGVNVGTVCYRNEPFTPIVRLLSLIPNRQIVDAKYLYYVLRNTVLSGTGSAQPQITAPMIKKQEILLLEDVKEQQKIAFFLSLIDDKIILNRQINDNLHQQAKAIFEHMFQENASTSPATIADIALNVTDGVHNTVKDDPEGQYLLLSCKNIKGGSLSIGSSERKINSETFEKLRRRTKLEKGDILISSVGTVGELLLLNTEPLNYEFQRSVAIVKPNPEFVSSAYVYESLVAQKAELINAAHGAVQQCLFISDIAGFPIGIPSTDTLRSFDETVKPMFDTISANEAENSRLEALRDTLLPKLMSGEIDVSDIDL